MRSRVVSAGRILGLGVLCAGALQCSLLISLDGLSGAPLGDGSAAEASASADGSDASLPETGGTGAQYVYVFGGKDANDSTNTVFVSAIGSEGALGPWTSAKPLPKPRAYAPAIDVGPAVFIFGGEGAGFHADGVVTRVSNGSLDAFATVPSFPVPRIRHGVVRSGDYVFVMGGYDDFGATLSEVRSAKIDSLSVGAWSMTTPLPSARSRFAHAATDKMVYVFGGSLANDAETTETIAATVQANGSLGGWTPGPSLPLGLNHMRAAVVGAHIVLTGGDSANGSGAEVFVGDIGASGYLDALRPTLPMPTPRHLHACVVAGKYLYVIGGVVGNGPVARVDYAELASDGSVLSWKPTTPLPAPRAYVSAVAR